MDVDLEDTKVLRLQATTKIDGVVLPQWLAVGTGVLFLCAVILLAMMYERHRTLEREIRLLDLHIQDVENVLIRNGDAKREDFAPRPKP